MSAPSDLPSPSAPQPQTPAPSGSVPIAAPVFPPLPGPDLISVCSFHLEVADYGLKGYHLNATVVPERVLSAAVELDRAGLALDTITGVDWLVEGQMEVVYDYFHPTTGLRVVVRTKVPRADPVLPSISQVFPGANWHERETHDFFGIEFSGHPNLTPFLLPEDATYHPLRKDFIA